MDTTIVDPKRTNVKARLITDVDYENLQPGDCFMVSNSADRLYFACPGCALPGSIVAGHPKSETRPSWDIVSGSLDDPTTLTLAPSISCQGCCKWHGHLIQGTFVSV